MKAELRAGATVEFTTPAEMAKMLDEHAAKLASILRRKPMGRTLRASGPAPVGGVSVIDLGSPPPGFEWEVRRYFVTGQDATTTLAGSAAVVFIATASDMLTPLDAVDTTATGTITTIPNKGSWTDDQVIVEFGRHLLIRCSGLGASVPFANAYVIERNSTQETTPDVVIPVNA
jgi:hypothetical protein